jgi:hypothetical protein
MFDHCVFRSTYATTVRDSKRARERDFLKAVSLHCTTLGQECMCSVCEKCFPLQLGGGHFLVALLPS